MAVSSLPISSPMSKPPIPRDRQEDVLHVLWMAIGALESQADRITGNQLDKDLVTAGYNVLNQIGYTDARPAWETRVATQSTP